MELREGYDSSWLDQMLAIYNRTEMKRSDRRKVDLAFKASHSVVSCWKADQLIGIGRMLSDGYMYSSIFDLVIDPDFQRQGIGKLIMNALIAKTPDATIHLTSTFGNESFYFDLGFRKHRTAMALYPASASPSQYIDHAWKPAR